MLQEFYWAQNIFTPDLKEANDFRFSLIYKAGLLLFAFEIQNFQLWILFVTLMHEAQ